MFSDFFIKRPVFSTVTSLFIVIAGAVCIPFLPVAQFPQLAPPQVSVNAFYTGANAQAVESSVTTLLEEAINGVEGMRYMTSTSGNDGSSSINITFELTRPLDLAAVDVQNRVQGVTGRLPDEVKNTGVTINKVASSFVMAAGFYSDNNRYSVGIRQQLHRYLCEGRDQAYSRRGRCADLRRTQILHAPVA